MNKLYSPSEIFTLIRSRLRPEHKIAFFSAVLIAFICHLFIMTNSMYNNDDIRYLYVDFDKPELGRWLLTYIAGISSYFSLPVVNSFLAILYLGLTSMVFVTIFPLTNRIFIVLMSGILVTFPTVATIFSYNFCIDPFMFSMLMSTLAAYFVTRSNHKCGWLIGAIFLCISVAIYQAYLPFTLVLMLIYYITMLLNPEAYDVSTLIKKGIRYLLMLIIGMGLYYIGMNATLSLKHISLSDYQGISDSDFPTPSEIAHRLVTILHDLYDFMKSNQVMTYNGWMVFATFASITLVTIIVVSLYFKKKLYKSLFRSLLLIICVVSLIPSIDVILLISDSVEMHMLMRHTWALLFVTPLIMSDLMTASFGISLRKLSEWICSIAVFLAVFNYFLLSNIAYFNMNFRYEKTYSLCLQIMDHLEEYEEYDKDLPIAFIGNYSKTYEMDATADLLEPMTGMKGSRIFKEHGRAYQPFIQNCLGYDIEVATNDEEDMLRETTEFLEMPRFPHDGSIKTINGFTVVKLND